MDETDRRIGRVDDDRRLLRLPEVMERTGLSMAMIYRLIRAGGLLSGSEEATATFVPVSPVVTDTSEQLR